MDYQTLKVCSLVSKSFKALYKSPGLDKTLFRRVKALAPDYKLDKANAVKLHPAFEWLSCKCNDEFKDIGFVSTKGDKTRTWKLAKTSAAKEYATMPALRRIRLQILDFKPLTITSKTGVTVRDVLATIWDHVFYSGAFSYPGDLLEPVTGEANGMTDFDWDDCEPDDLRFADGFLPGVAWRGFSRHTLDDKGSLLLHWDCYQYSDEDSMDGCSSCEDSEMDPEDYELDGDEEEE